MGTHSTKDKIEGALEKTKGSAIEVAGPLSGNEAIKAAGKAGQAKGTLKMTKGGAKDRLREGQANKFVLKGRATTFRSFLHALIHLSAPNITAERSASRSERIRDRGTPDGCRLGARSAP
jgi:uncharacterized protein YjbJ (UPF0337 family)